MLAEWLTLTLDGEAPDARQGRLPFARYVVHAPGVLELIPSAARQRLLQDSADTIAQIAMDCGFASASSFSAFYRERYGELPAQTRTRRF